MRKEYMGEVTIPLSDWFPKGEVAMWSNDLPVSRCSTVLLVRS